MNICTACWQGQYINGVCNHCSYKKEAEAARRVDALPLMNVVNGRYHIGAVLGKGGFGITYSAWDAKQNIRVALKELYPNSSVVRSSGSTQLTINAGHEEYFAGMKRKFKEEAQLLYSLRDNRDIVKVYDLFECNRTVYYAMEYLEGCDLNKYRKEHGRLSWQFLQPIMKQILQTLSILHKKNLIHRDISPDNIFLLRNNTVKLIDFGSARTYQGKLEITVFKKDGFAPWEQITADGKQGPWTDFYALSATMYLLLSGKLPPSAEKRSIGAQVIPLRELCPELPDMVVKAIEKGMRMEIPQRFQSAEEYMTALGIRQVEPPPPPPPQQPRPPEPPRPTPPPPPTPPTKFWLYGRNGIYLGQRKQLEINREIVLGRMHTCDITFPENTRGVSRTQCILFISPSGEAFIKDANSTFGTFLDNRRLGTSWVRIFPKQQIRFGNEYFELVY